MPEGYGQLENSIWQNLRKAMLYDAALHTYGVSLRRSRLTATRCRPIQGQDLSNHQPEGYGLLENSIWRCYKLTRNAMQRA